MKHKANWFLIGLLPIVFFYFKFTEADSGEESMGLAYAFLYLGAPIALVSIVLFLVFRFWVWRK